MKGNILIMIGSLFIVIMSILFLWSAITAVANAGGDALVISVNSAVQGYIIIYIILGIFGIITSIIHIIKRNEGSIKWISFVLSILIFIYTIEFLIEYIPILAGSYEIWYIFFRIFIYAIIISNLISLIGATLQIIS